MSASTVLAEVQRLGGYVEPVAGGMLRITAPWGAIGPELLVELRRNKPEILRALGALHERREDAEAAAEELVN